MTTYRSVRTATLEIACEEHGGSSDDAVVLLHGFPDDVRAYDGVVGSLVDDGMRVVVPYLRGHGPTRFADPSARWTAQQAAIGQDVIDLLDGLELPDAVLAGFDWGGRAACVASIFAPDRVRGLVTIGGYNVQDTLRPAPPADPAQLRAHWYQWFFNTEPGRIGLTQRRREIARSLWHEWSPTWRFTEEEFTRTATSFDNDAFVDVVLHSYRHRWGHAAGEPRFAAAEEHLATRPPITVPTVVLHGGDDRVAPPSRSAGQESLFPPSTPRYVVDGVGHFLPRERPAALVAAIREVARHPHASAG